MKLSFRKNSVSSMLLQKSMPVLFFCLFGSSFLIVAGYISQTKALIAENNKLNSQRIADAIDAEIASAEQTLINHQNNWSSELRSPGDIEKYLETLVASNPGFATFGLKTENGYERKIGDMEFSPSYIQDLVFSKNKNLSILTSGITSSDYEAMDIWFEFTLPTSAPRKTTVRALYRLKDHLTVVSQIDEAYPEAIIVLKPQGVTGIRFSVNQQSTSKANARALELNPTRGFVTTDLSGTSYYVSTQNLKKISADIIFATLKSEVDGYRFFAITIFLLLNFIGVGFTGFLIASTGRSQREFLVSAAENVKKIGLGEEQPILAYSDIVEHQGLTEAVTELIRLQSAGKAQSKVVNKAMFDLFACHDSQSAIVKCVELICTQCQAETAWFEPFVADQEFYRQDKQKQRVIKGWQWKNHRINDFEYTSAVQIQAAYPEKNVVNFTIKANLEVIGTLKAFYMNGAEDVTRLMLDSLVSILEKTLARHDAIKKGVLISTEVDIADSIQKSVVSTVDNASDGRVVQYFKPADRLGGDWFYMIPTKSRECCYFIMGRVSGHGVSQGLLTAGVRGCLDVLDNLIRLNGSDLFESPADLIPMIRRVVTSMNSSEESTVTCFVMHVDFISGAVKVANTGHALPLIVRPMNQKTSVLAIKDIGKSTTENGIKVWQTVLEKGDYIVAFSDGLSNAKGFKSEIFERFMIRSLEGGQGYQTASQLIDDLKNFYNYYTSNKKQNDDVCFMAIKIEDVRDFKKAG